MKLEYVYLYTPDDSLVLVTIEDNVLTFEALNYIQKRPIPWEIAKDLLKQDKNNWVFLGEL